MARRALPCSRSPTSPSTPTARSPSSIRSAGGPPRRRPRGWCPSPRSWSGRRDQRLLCPRPPIACGRSPAGIRTRPRSCSPGRARFREALHGVLAAVEAGTPLRRDALDTLAHSLATAYAHGHLVPHDGRPAVGLRGRRRPRSRGVGDRPRHRTPRALAAPGPRPRLRRRRLRLVVPRRDEESQPAMVRHENLRQPREAQALWKEARLGSPRARRTCSTRTILAAT